ncbi:MAG: hypothetical protein BM560_01040 [Roseobacter sp. MedPE-SWde]|nr:MAG: hypothetical protein BM560_01040 [Roseobacter sp. MedPE-SWde]
MRHFLIIATFLTATPAFAETCPEIENDLDRLACYDRESGRTETVTEVPTTKGDWQIRIESSEFRDTTDVFLSLASENTLSCRGYGTPKPANLVVRCLENTTALIITTDCHLTSGHGGYGRVEYRFDEKPARKREFTESTNNRSLGLWTGGKSIPFIKGMLGSDRAIFRFTPYSSNPVTAKFNITGLDEAIAPLREECSW